MGGYGVDKVATQHNHLFASCQVPDRHIRTATMDTAMDMSTYTYVFAIGTMFALLEAYNNGASTS